MIDILHADNIVFAEIGTRLHLDQVERDLPGILKTMHAAQRNKDRFILAKEDFLIVARNNRGAVDDNPVLGAMEMFL